MVSIRDCVHSGLCPLGIASIGDDVHSGMCPFGMVSIRNGVHSEWCPFGIVSIRYGVHSLWCPFEIVSIRDCIHSGLCPSGLCLSGWCPFGQLSGYQDTLPNTSTTKHKLALAKSEFDMRVKDWLKSERVLIAKKSKRSTLLETFKKDVDILSRKSSCSSRSSMKSGMSSRHKKVLVKYKMAVFAKDLEAEKS